MPITLPLTKGYSAIIDDEDAHLAKFKWCALVTKRTVYAKRRVYHGKIDGRYVYSGLSLHRAVMNAPAGTQVDHIDGDGLNCRRSNLRLVTCAQNHANRRADRGNVTGLKGVECIRGGKRWGARIGVHGRVIRLGYFSTAEGAARAYDAAAREHFGEFARLNFPA